MIKSFFIFLLAILSILYQGNHPQIFDSLINPVKTIYTNSEQNKASSQDLQSIAHDVLLEIKNKDFEKLSLMINPQKGLRFEPYFEQHFLGQVFSIEEFKKVYSSPKKYLWGKYDGSGNPIDMSFNEYYQNFVYAKDFAKVKPIHYKMDSPKLSQAIFGSSPQYDFDWTDKYPQGEVFYYYYPDREDGNGWASLGLVLEKEKDEWYLVAVFRDVWEI